MKTVLPHHEFRRSFEVTFSISERLYALLSDPALRGLPVAGIPGQFVWYRYSPDYRHRNVWTVRQQADIFTLTFHGTLSEMKMGFGPIWPGDYEELTELAEQFLLLHVNVPDSFQEFVKVLSCLEY